MAARFFRSKPPYRRTMTSTLSLLVLESDHGSTVLLGQESRKAAEAALPPSAGALEILTASRAIYYAEMALKTAAGADELIRLRSALEKAQEALRAAIERLSDANGGS